MDLGIEQFTSDGVSTSGSTKSVYEDSKRNTIGTTAGDSADEIDPRKLHKTPQLNLIRWLYRNSIAKTLIDKPVDDVFKNGFNVKHDNTKQVKDTLDEFDFIEKYKSALKKSRRDGFSLLFGVLRDNSNGVEEKPDTVTSIKELRILTIDDLTDTEPTDILDELPEKYEYPKDIEILEEGVVVSKLFDDEYYEKPIGYVVEVNKDTNKTKFIHESRTLKFTHNREVDGDIDKKVYGNIVGDSIIQSCVYLLKALEKGNWAIMQTVYRYSSQLYVAELPEDANEEDQNQADEKLQNLNAKSSVTLPHGYDIDSHGTDGQLDPRNYFDIVFEQICASTEMTKTVLFGTQSGTVSGSETDIKNYFNQVKRMRDRRINNDIHRFIEWVANLDWAKGVNKPIHNLALDFDIEWNPLFKLSELDGAEVLRTVLNALQMGINSFIISPQEARTIIQEKFDEIKLDDLSEDEKDLLKEINLTQIGVQSEAKGNRQKQNGGGRERGDDLNSTQPQRDKQRDKGSEISKQEMKETIKEFMADEKDIDN